MNNSRLIRITIICILLISSYFFATKYALYYKIKSYLQHYQKDNLLSGVVLIAHKDQILYHHAFGSADKERYRSNTVKSEFLIGSITKEFTAAAILDLSDKKLLDLDKPVSHYLNAAHSLWKNKIPEWANHITIHQLLTHSSGLAEYVLLPDFKNFYKNPHSTQELIQFFAYNPLTFNPGSKYEYSGSGYNVLGVLIEEISGKSYGNFLHDTFFAPLHLKQIYAPHSQLLSQVMPDHPSISVGYNINPTIKQILKTGEVNLSTAFAEASVISTAQDLYKFLYALYTNQIVSNNAFKRMTTAYFTTEDNLGVGYGIFIDTSLGYQTYVHTGRINGFESIALYNPSKQLTVIVLSNLLGSNIFSLGYSLMELITKYTDNGDKI